MTNEQAINQLKDMQSRCTNGYDAEAINNAIKALEERPTGEWYYSCQNGWHCSICQQIVKDMPTVMGKANFDYCPKCGARMEAEDE